MKPVIQTRFGHGEGNCFAAAIASILEVGIDDVPNLRLDDSWGDYLDRLYAWLGERGLTYIEINPDGFQTASSNQWGYHLICGNGPRKRPDGRPIQHAIVGQAGRFKHDPHPSGDFLLPETADNRYHYGFLVSRFT